MVFPTSHKSSILSPSFEEEFLAHIVLPDGTTVGQQIRPHIEKAYIDGKMPRLLLSATAGE